MYRILVLLFGLFFTFGLSAQSLTTLDLPVASNGDGLSNYTQSQLKLIGNILYVPTFDGIYSIDLDHQEEGWRQTGFKGQKIIEFVKKGSEVIAITRNIGSNIMLYSSDNGSTFTDISPLEYSYSPQQCAITRIVQDPIDEDVIYTTGVTFGVLKSEDFGKTWHQITEYLFYNRTYTGLEIHPIDQNIITQHGESWTFAPQLQISYDGGETWKNTLGYPDPEIKLSKDFQGDNCIHDIAFHPTDINTWVFGGEGIICKSTNRGMNWDMKVNGWRQEVSLGCLYSTVYDCKDSNVLYSIGAGISYEMKLELRFYVSPDGGESWQNVLVEYLAANKNIYEDMIQDEHNLIILIQDDVLLISKQTLLKNLNSSSVNKITTDIDTYEEVYNLQGKRLSSDPEHGFYIKCGKKLYKK